MASGSCMAYELYIVCKANLADVGGKSFHETIPLRAARCGTLGG